MTDLRPDRPDLWSEPTAFGDRAHFRVSTRPAVLSVTGVQRFDAGTYTCRVDFRQSPTVYHHVKLDIIGELRILIQECTVCMLSIFMWKRIVQSVEKYYITRSCSKNFREINSLVRTLIWQKNWSDNFHHTTNAHWKNRNLLLL